MTLLPGDRLTVKEKVAYGIGDMGFNFFFQFFNIFLFYYYTDVYGLSAAVVGVMITITRVTDAVTDPVMGMIADRTQTRWGKFRPYLLFGALPYALLGYLMFANPPLEGWVKVAYAYITYSLVWLMFTITNIPYSAMMGVLTPNPKERTILSSYRFAFAFGGGIAIGAISLPLVNFFGQGDDGAGFSRTMLLFSIFSALIFLVTFKFCKERVQPPKTQQSSIEKDIDMLLRNRAWVVMVFTAFIGLSGAGMRAAAGVYYFKYVVGDENLVTVFVTSGMICQTIGVALTGQMMKLAPRRTLMLILPVLSGLATLGFYFVDPSQYTLLLVLNGFAAFIVGPTSAIAWSFYADAADYGEWKLGRRATALVFSATTFAIKISFAIGSGLLGLVLTYHGFIANQDQTDFSLRGILFSFSVYPGILLILSGVIILLYPLNEAKNKLMEKELKERRALADDEAVPVAQA